MTYRLVLLTHGEAPHLGRVLESFAAMVTPAPSERVCVVDGEGAFPPVEPLGAFEGLAGGPQRGFCEATATAWKLAARAGTDWTFYVENDFVFTRPLDLRQVADVLTQNPRVAQMALCRQAVNEQERAAGGLVASRPGQFFARRTNGQPWLEHMAYWTTNPSLFRRDFAERYDWPVEEFCEGKFGIHLRQQDPTLTFGLWGSGEEWIEHVGVRDGYGY